MKSIAFLFLAANICLAQDVPRLSLVASTPLSRGTALTAWSDTVAVGDSGRIGYFARGSSGIVRTDSAAASFGSASPRIYHLSAGRELVVGATEFVMIENRDGVRSAKAVSDKRDFGTGYSQGGLYMSSDDSGRPVRNLLVCQDGRLFHMRERADGIWYRLDSTRLRNGKRYVCATDPSFSQRVVFEILTVVSHDGRNGLEYGYPKVGSGAPVSEQGVYDDTIYASKIDWTLAGLGGRWLVYDQAKGNLRFNFGPGPFHAPGLLHLDGVPSKPSSPLLVARKDSLVVVASDNQLIFLKWNSNGVQELGRFLDAPSEIRSIALADSTLWVRTATDLFMYDLAWNGSGMSSVIASPLRRNLSVAAIAGGASLVWRGTGDAEIRIAGADGRIEASFSMRPGETRNWHPASKGVFFASTPSGNRRIVVR